MVMMKRSLALLMLGLLGAASLERTAAAGDCSGGAVACTADYVPVCGSDGKTYSNKCALSLAQCKATGLTLVTDGECAAGGSASPSPVTTAPSSTPSCGPVACTAIYAPVCGSDGKTYSSECELNVAKCSTPTLKLVISGECAASGNSGSGGGGGANVVKAPSPSPNTVSKSGSRANAEVVAPTPSKTSGASGVHAAAATVVIAGLTSLLVVG